MPTGILCPAVDGIKESEDQQAARDSSPSAVVNPCFVHDGQVSRRASCYQLPSEARSGVCVNSVWGGRYRLAKRYPVFRNIRPAQTLWLVTMLVHPHGL